MSWLKKKMNNRGVTIAEAVVAMAVIVVVSMAAMTCVESFTRSSANVCARNEALVVSETALEVFKVTEFFGFTSHTEDTVPDDSYRKLMSELVSVEPTSIAKNPNSAGGDTTLNTDQIVLRVYKEHYLVYGCDIDITIEYRRDANNGADVTKNTAIFSVEAKDNRGREILKIDSYEKPLTNITAEFRRADTEAS
ncbi:MAG: hypothetical protein IJS71_02090 [Clostridia bacterium]|nr:hypothetical protein [Clostridia bacterium]